LLVNVYQIIKKLPCKANLLTSDCGHHQIGPTLRQNPEQIFTFFILKITVTL